LRESLKEKANIRARDFKVDKIIDQWVSVNGKSLGCIVWYNLQYFSLVGDEMIFNAIIEKDKYGYFARVPELEGCVSQGDTYEEVLENIKEALELYLESLSKEEKETSNEFVGKSPYTNRGCDFSHTVYA